MYILKGYGYLAYNYIGRALFVRLSKDGERVETAVRAKLEDYVFLQSIAIKWVYRLMNTE